MREIKFRGHDINGNYVYGLLTKKKIRSNGTIRYAIAKGNCSMAETVPIGDEFAQLIGVDVRGKEVYEGDKVIRIASTDEDFDPEKTFPMYATFEDFAAIRDGEIVLVV